jgi:glycosyltransferase involved in cell wall biosynthesis
MISTISFHSVLENQIPVFSILIPSWNNLDYLKCCIESIKKNSTYPHQIIVHINEGSDGTLEWVKSQHLSYSYSTTNVGICYGFNAPAVLARSDYLVLSDDDFYFTPHWDDSLFEEIKKLDHFYFCIAGTMIEHTTTTNRCAIAPYDFGRTINTFDEQKLLREFKSIRFPDWNGGNWYPMVLHKRIWELIGGLSVELSPGMGSDPDMMMKLWHCGVRYYKGVGASRVYHFGSRTTDRIKKNNGYNQFLLKWGLSNSTFFRIFLRQGEPFQGYVDNPPGTGELRARLWKDTVKRVLAAFGTGSRSVSGKR